MYEGALQRSAASPADTAAAGWRRSSSRLASSISTVSVDGDCCISLQLRGEMTLPSSSRRCIEPDVLANPLGEPEAAPQLARHERRTIDRTLSRIDIVTEDVLWAKDGPWKTLTRRPDFVEHESSHTRACGGSVQWPHAATPRCGRRLPTQFQGTYRCLSMCATRSLSVTPSSAKK
jgi:hypothetical protein